MSDAATSINLSTVGLLLLALSTLTGAGGLTLLERAFEPGKDGRGRTAPMTVGVAAVLVAVVALLEACRLIQAAIRLA